VSDRDSFIDEVADEIRRDRLFALMRRYGWIPILVVVLIVGGAAWNEYRKAQQTAQARAFGDAILTALEAPEPAGRIDALQAIEAPGADAGAVLQLLMASEQAAAGDPEAAVSRLRGLSDEAGIAPVYRQIASYKALTRGADLLPLAERRAGFEALSTPGQPLRLLAEEQLALIEIETGEDAAARERLQRVLADSEVTAGLRRRAAQLIVALGGTPEPGG
jgi:hypothetical protein